MKPPDNCPLCNKPLSYAVTIYFSGYSIFRELMIIIKRWLRIKPVLLQCTSLQCSFKHLYDQTRFYKNNWTDTWHKRHGCNHLIITRDTRDNTTSIRYQFPSTPNKIFHVWNEIKSLEEINLFLLKSQLL